MTYKKIKAEKIIGNIGILVFTIMVVGGLGVGIYSAIKNISPKEKYRIKAKQEVVQLTKEAIKKSAGEDKIWTLNEKRKFLDDDGLSELIMQETHDIYFRAYLEYDKNRALIKDYNNMGIEVYTGYKLDNNRGFLRGSTAKSGELEGKITRKQLEKYVKNEREK